MFRVKQPQNGDTRDEGGPEHPGWSGIGIVFFLCAVWLILWLMGCSSSRKEYVVDRTHGNDLNAQGSRERPCQTEVYCRMLAERDGAPSFWMVYQ